MADLALMIRLYDREHQGLTEETVFQVQQMKRLYNHPLGKLLERALVSRPWFSKIYPQIMTRQMPAQEQIAYFVKQYAIDTDELLYPLDHFASFNQFFIRELKPEARPMPVDSDILISPADARLLALPIQKETVYPIKGREWNLRQLLANRNLAHQFEGGQALIYRLAPVDYHRYAYIDSGSHGPQVDLPGALHSVSPIALETGLSVFTQNRRSYTLLKTRHFGPVLQMEVGALMVGRIVNHLTGQATFERGQERGYFEWGGSTIIQLFSQDAIQVDSDILAYSAQGIETLVKYRSQVGHRYADSSD